MTRLIAAAAWLCLSAIASADIINPGQQGPSLELPRGEAAIDDAIARFRARDYSESLKRLENATRDRADLPPARVLLAKLFILDGQIARGRDVLERAAIDTPSHPEVFLTFAKLSLADGRWTDASLALQRAETCLGKGSLSEGYRSVIHREVTIGNAAVAEARGD